MTLRSAGDPAALDAVRWIHGARPVRRATEPPVQVHAHDPETWVLRQAKSSHPEAPFLYLFAGADRALLLDTGATPDPARFPLRRTVDELLADRSGAGGAAYSLVVAHTHDHYDHVDGDSQFAGRPGTVTVGKGPDAVAAFFGFTGWPSQVVPFDLGGGRVLEVTGIPGHDAASIAVYDPWTGFLVTGDTVYPGRLYVEDAPAFVASLDRLVDLARSRPVTRVLGCHVEMRRAPRRDYPIAATWQPDERPLPITVDQLVAVRDAARSVADRPGRHVFDDVIVFNGPCRRRMVVEHARTAGSWLRDRAAGWRPGR